MCKNKLIIAAAGSGKTTLLVKQALQQKNSRVLITTYTRANESEIRKKIIQCNKCIPANITIQTWFSFLLNNGVRPFQLSLFEKKIKGLQLVNSQSGIKYRTKKGVPVYFKEDGEFEKHYFTEELKIYSDKLSKFVIRCNEKSAGAVINRISRIYEYIYIDEVQDLAGYDLEILKLFFKSSTKTLLVGDPSQGTYSTNSTAKNKKYRKSEIVNFFDTIPSNLEKDDKSLMINYRSNPLICKLSNNLFLNYPQTKSGNEIKTGHDGLFFIKKSDVDSYLQKFNPIQLRENIKTKINDRFISINFGDSKGLTFDRVLIYPTKPIIKWILDNANNLAPTSRAKFYVAITRARYSVGIVYDYDSNTNVESITNYT